MTAKRLAVLIDGGNIAGKYARSIFEEIAKYGDASIRRIYGNFDGSNLDAWKPHLDTFAIIPVHQSPSVKGKNADDIALVIDAMDLLHLDRFDAMVLVSSDSDFTRLATRIREHGKDVIGIGEQKTNQAFRNACNRFIYAESLENKVVKQDGKKLTINHAQQLVSNIFDNIQTEEEKIALSSLGSQLRQRYPDFDSRNYGFKKLRDLVKKLENFEVDEDNFVIRSEKA